MNSLNYLLVTHLCSDAPVVKITEGVRENSAQFRSFNLSGMDIQTSARALNCHFHSYSSSKMLETPHASSSGLLDRIITMERPEEIVYGRRWK